VFVFAAAVLQIKIDEKQLSYCERKVHRFEQFLKCICYNMIFIVYSD